MRVSTWIRTLAGGQSADCARLEQGPSTAQRASGHLTLARMQCLVAGPPRRRQATRAPQAVVYPTDGIIAHAHAPRTTGSIRQQCTDQEDGTNGAAAIEFVAGDVPSAGEWWHHVATRPDRERSCPRERGTAEKSARRSV